MLMFSWPLAATKLQSRNSLMYFELLSLDVFRGSPNAQ